MENLKDSDWRSLIRIIQKGNCILVLGPDALVDPEDPRGAPLHIKLARNLAEKLDDDQQLCRQDDLAHIAQVYQSRHDRITLEIAVEDFYRSYENNTTGFHQQLANLPFTVCINTNHDDLLANAFDAVGKNQFAISTGFANTNP